MTRALHEFVPDVHQEVEAIQDPKKIDELGREIRNTANEIRTHEASPETIAELKKAVKMLGLTEAPDYEKLLPTAEAAAVTGDSDMMISVNDLLQQAFPINKKDQDPAVTAMNRNTHREFATAIVDTHENNTPFPLALSRAALRTDAIRHEDFDETIVTSNELMREQRRREAEAKILQELGVYYDEKFDDAERYDPFADEKVA